MQQRISSLIKLQALAVALAAFSSCIKDEALNAEADITGASLPDSTLLIRHPDVTNEAVTIYANTADSILAPTFTLTPGATITPESGTPRQFFSRRPNPDKAAPNDGQPDSVNVPTPQRYTVTSEDGRWQKTYTVTIVNNGTPADYHFDNVRTYTYNGRDTYHIFYETIGGSATDWGSGNPGVLVTLLSKRPSPADFPTSQSADGWKGACAKLTTISTGALGKTFGAPIAAGNLFLGTFAVNFGNMPSSTHFGVPLRATRPLRFSGYYKYRAGETVTDKDMNAVAGAHDDFALYAVVFEPTPDVPWLDGQEGKTNSLNSPNIVLRAELTDHQEAGEWLHFDIPFEEVGTFDHQKLADGRYSIAIVLSSSKDGNIFVGAIGSTLYVDELHIEYE